MASDNAPRQIVAACAMVSRANGDILMVKTGYRPGWEFPGGQVEIGESPMQAVIREVFEETGVTTNIMTLTGIYTNITRGLVIFAFLGEYVSGDLTPSSETPEVAWIQCDKVQGLVEEATFIDRARDMLQYDGKIIHKAYTKNPYTIISRSETS